MLSMFTSSVRQNGHVSVISNLAEMQEKGELCDFSILIAEKEFLAHKCILAASCEYFRAAFRFSYSNHSGAMSAESASSLDLTHLGCRPEVVKCVVRSFYTNEIDLCPSVVQDLLLLADYLMYPELRVCVETFMLQTLDHHTAIVYFQLAKHYGLDTTHLEAKVSNLLQAHFHDYFIYQPDAVKINLDTLQYYMCCGFFKFCSPLQICKFFLTSVEIILKKPEHLGLTQTQSQCLDVRGVNQILSQLVHVLAMFPPCHLKRWQKTVLEYVKEWSIKSLSVQDISKSLQQSLEQLTTAPASQMSKTFCALSHHCVICSHSPSETSNQKLDHCNDSFPAADYSIPQDSNIDGPQSSSSFTDKSIPQDSNIDGPQSSSSFTDKSIPQDSNIDGPQSSSSFTDKSIPQDSNIDGPQSSSSLINKSIPQNSNIDGPQSSSSFTDQSIPQDSNIDGPQCTSSFTDKSIPQDFNINGPQSSSSFTDQKYIPHNSNICDPQIRSSSSDSDKIIAQDSNISDPQCRGSFSSFPETVTSSKNSAHISNLDKDGHNQHSKVPRDLPPVVSSSSKILVLLAPSTEMASQLMATDEGDYRPLVKFPQLQLSLYDIEMMIWRSVGTFDFPVSGAMLDKHVWRIAFLNNRLYFFSLFKEKALEFNILEKQWTTLTCKDPFSPHGEQAPVKSLIPVVVAGKLIVLSMSKQSKADGTYSTQQRFYEMEPESKTFFLAATVDGDDMELPITQWTVSGDMLITIKANSMMFRQLSRLQYIHCYNAYSRKLTTHKVSCTMESGIKILVRGHSMFLLDKSGWYRSYNLDSGDWTGLTRYPEYSQPRGVASLVDASDVTYPALTRVTCHAGASRWQVNTMLHPSKSHLEEMVVGGDGELTTLDRTPPPHQFVTAMCAGSMETEKLWAFQQASFEYLEDLKEFPMELKVCPAQRNDHWQA